MEVLEELTRLLELLKLLERELELIKMLEEPNELLELKRELELLEMLDELLGINEDELEALLLDGINEDELEALLLDGINEEELETLLLTRLLLVARLELDPLHTAPVTGGRCAGELATPLLPCTPNSTVCPGLIRSFQPIPVAV